MHIEPGIVDGAKIALGHATAAAAAATVLWQARSDIRAGGIAPFALRSAVAALGTLICFEILPHFSAGVSEVHFILATTLFLMLGAAPAAVGLAGGLLLQGLVLSPSDLPQLGMNLTTLLVPLLVLAAAARRIVAPGTAYVDLRYTQVLAMSGIYQGGVVAWVAFWVTWGQGFGAETMAGIGAFAAAYAVVLIIEPLADLGALALARRLRGRTALLDARLFRGA
jgi:hypothetical protein